MQEEKIKQILCSQREFFKTGKTLSHEFRKKQLTALYDTVRRHEADIAAALKADLSKSAQESYMTETGLVLSEITYLKRHLSSFMKKKRAHTPLAQSLAKSFTLSSPYGNTLIISPWNYPVLLTLEPLADAISAGNTVILKPSAYSQATSALIEQIIAECFPSNYVAVLTGGRAENQALLQQKFDMIFFTGSEAVGKEVLRSAAEHLTPCVLELGGKSPCIVDESASVATTARRIVFGKFLNAGQTCVAPDYILCAESIKSSLIAAIKAEITRQFGENPLKNPDYGKIINEKHFNRLTKMLDPSKTVFGGECDRATLRVAPTVMDNVTASDAVMSEEIFGPILPIVSYSNFDTMLSELKAKPEPLALYIFSSDKRRIERVMHEISYGGGCVNDVVIHLATSHMGFGGVGRSGMGAYHGRDGFNAFSHTKSMVDKKTFLDLTVRYAPYKSKLYERLVHLLLK